jgi:hypothetical protein
MKEQRIILRPLEENKGNFLALDVAPESTFHLLRLMCNSDMFESLEAKHNNNNN